MKTVYIRQNEKKVNVEVGDELYEEIKYMRRKEWRNDKNFQNRFLSIEGLMERKFDFIDNSQNPEFLIEKREEIKQKNLQIKRLSQGIKTLSYKQKSALYKHFFLYMSYAAIARDEQIGKSAVADRIQSGIKKIKKYFEKHPYEMPFFF